MIYDVAVIGLGLGGASAAISLARRGLQVLAIEAGEFPRHKVCGEFLSPESKSTLSRLGVLNELEIRGAHHIHRAHIFAPDGRSLETPIPNTALSISRWVLDAVMAQTARDCGVDIRTQHRVRKVERDANCWLVTTTHTSQIRTFRARRVIGAPGRNASWFDDNSGEKQTDHVRYVGFKTHFSDTQVAPHTIELHSWRGGYCGASQIENGIVNACLLARYDSVLNRKPADFWRDLLVQLPLLRARFEGAKLEMNWLATANVVFAPPSPLRRFARETLSASTCTYQEEAVLCAGDAAGFIHPLTGDGMSMALRGGELAAAAIYASLCAHVSPRETAQIYQAAWQREFGARLKWAAWLQKVLIEPEWTAPVLSLGARVPLLGRLAVAKTRGSTF